MTLTDANPISNLLGASAVAEKVLRPEGIRVLYRGFIPFAAMSLAFPLYLPKLWSLDTQVEVLDRLEPTLNYHKQKEQNTFDF